MLDQKTKYTLRGIKTEFVGDAQSDEKVEAVVNGLVLLAQTKPSLPKHVEVSCIPGKDDRICY